MDMSAVGGEAGPRLDDVSVESRLEALDRLLEAVEALPEAPGELARDAIAALVEIYGEALARLVDVASEGEEGSARVGRLARDPLVGHLLALYGLHPEPVVTRLDRALAQLEGQLDGATAELAGIDGDVASVIVRGVAGPADALCATIRAALLGEAPELRDVQAVPAVTSTRIAVESLRVRRPG